MAAILCVRDDRGMGKIIRMGVVSFALLALVASTKRHVPFSPGTAKAAPDTMERASQALIMRGFSIENRDTSIVTSEWKEKLEMGSYRRERWVVRVNDGIVTVDNQCEFRIKDPAPFTSNDWENCGERREEGRAEEAAAIAKEIGVP